MLMLVCTSRVLQCDGPVWRGATDPRGVSALSQQLTHLTFFVPFPEAFCHSSRYFVPAHYPIFYAMRFVAMPPSSPTPFNPQIHHGPISLIPDSENNSRRALTRAASSDVEGERHPLNMTSTGYVTATGLINWRRRKKSTSARSAASSAAGKLGPGMGMQGTPARRKKRKTGTSRVSD